MNWDESVEGLLQKYCDESQTREALHRRSFYSYKKLTTCFNLPVIVLSCLSGSLQFLSKGYPDIEQYIVTGTASLSILTAIISAVSSYLKLGESMSRHEQSANSWLLFHNGLKHLRCDGTSVRMRTSFCKSVKPSTTGCLSFRRSAAAPRSKQSRRKSIKTLQKSSLRRRISTVFVTLRCTVSEMKMSTKTIPFEEPCTRRRGTRPKAVLKLFEHRHTSGKLRGGSPGCALVATCTHELSHV